MFAQVTVPVVQVSALPLRSYAGVEFVGDPFVRKLNSHVAPVQELKAHALVQLDLEDTGGWRHVCTGIIPPLSYDVPVFVRDEPPRLLQTTPSDEILLNHNGPLQECTAGSMSEQHP